MCINWGSVDRDDGGFVCPSRNDNPVLKYLVLGERRTLTTRLTRLLFPEVLTRFHFSAPVESLGSRTRGVNSRGPQFRVEGGTWSKY